MLTCTVTDIQRNFASIAEKAREEQQPIYITRNGAANLVLIDADKYENDMRMQQAIYEREWRTYESVMQGIQEVEEGKTRPYSEVREELQEKGLL